MTCIRRSLLVAAMLLAVGGCGRHSTPLEVPLASLPESEELLVAPPEALVAGVRLTMRVDAARNIMPGSHAVGLMVRATLVSSGTPIPDGVALDRVYVLHGERVWVSELDTADHPPTSQLEATARNGPMWGTESLVDVAVRLRVPEGSDVYLASRGVQIRLLQ